jgi:pyrroline-5-carboxylate reductase
MANELAFIGAGRMAGAMVRGILKTGKWLPAGIICTSARDGTAEALAGDTGIAFSYDWEELLADASWVVLACKPQQLKELPESLAGSTSGARVLSILAGTSLARLRAVFPRAANLIRCMPNTPGMIGRGITAYSALHPLAGADRQSVEALLGALGEALPLPESALDAVTGLSGSGPAYVFEFVAALRDGGIAAGLDPDTAYRLALRTVQGAAALLEAVPEPPETHRGWVSSPGGTTLAGLGAMERGRFREVIRETVLAATRRSRELAEE